MLEKSCCGGGKHEPGRYVITNSNTFKTTYGEDREYFEVYSKKIKSLYSQVHWKSHGSMSLPKNIVNRFSGGKLMAITGYEVDQVRRTESGEEVAVPITWAYNHHYVAYVLNSKKARLVKKKIPNEVSRRGMNHGAQEHWQAELLDDQLGSNEIPQVHMFSEGNGGEMRSSYHGYPKGYAQIVESPDTYMIAPMQIVTWNRNMKNSSFLPGPLLRSSRIPPEAGYSGLLECPCTDRIDFELGMTYSLTIARHQFRTRRNVSRPSSNFSSRNITTLRRFTTRSYPVGAVVHSHAETTANSTSLVGVALGIVNLTVSIDGTKGKRAVQLRLSGPEDTWFGVGFGSDSMCLKMQGDECPVGGPYALIVLGDEVVERKLDFHGQEQSFPVA
eukprot:scaffold5048_cov121-Cylindrotheca_fusiformis.AAC.9